MIKQSDFNKIPLRIREELAKHGQLRKEYIEQRFRQQYNNLKEIKKGLFHQNMEQAELVNQQSDPFYKKVDIQEQINQMIDN